MTQVWEQSPTEGHLEVSLRMSLLYISCLTSWKDARGSVLSPDSGKIFSLPSSTAVVTTL